MDKIAAYMDDLPAAQRKQLERVRDAIRHAAPQATEAISYGMPAFKQDGKYLVGYAAFKSHFGFFPTPGPIDALSKELEGFTLSKGTVQFTLEHPLPDSLIQKLVKERLREITAS